MEVLYERGEQVLYGGEIFIVSGVGTSLMRIVPIGTPPEANFSESIIVLKSKVTKNLGYEINGNKYV